MAKKLKLYISVVEDVIPLLIIGFGHNEKQVFKKIEEVYPSYNLEDSGVTIVQYPPIEISNGKIFMMDGDNLDILEDNAALKERFSFFLEGEGFEITDIIKDNKDEKSDDLSQQSKEPDEEFKWA